MTYHKLKGREKVEAIDSCYLIKKKVEQRSGGRTYFMASFQIEDWVKKSKEVTRDTSHLIQDSQTFFWHVSTSIYYFILS